MNILEEISNEFLVWFSVRNKKKIRIMAWKRAISRAARISQEKIRIYFPGILCSYTITIYIQME